MSSAPHDAAAESAVRRLLADYCHLIDDGELDAWVRLFWDDAELAMGRKSWVTPEERRTWVGGVKAALGSSRHLLTNVAIDLDGDVATVLSDYALVMAGPSLAQVGRYEDRIERRHGRWLFAARRISPLRAPAPVELAPTGQTPENAGG